MTFFSQARRTCGTTHFIRLCTILHATGFGLPPKFEDCRIYYSLISVQKKIPSEKYHSLKMRKCFIGL
jgi:hypothetical protein